MKKEDINWSRVKMDERKFQAKLGFESDGYFVDMVKDGLIEIVGEKNDEYIYSATKKGNKLFNINNPK